MRQPTTNKGLLHKPQYGKLVNLHCQLMQAITSKEELVKICQELPIDAERCQRLGMPEQRDSLRELILHMQRCGLRETLLNFCQLHYPQINLDTHSQPSVNPQRRKEVSKLLASKQDAKPKLTHLLAKLSADDLRHLLFLLEMRFEMVSYFWFLPSDVNISIPTETEIQKRLENPLPAKYKSREEYETNYRKIHSPPTEKQMRKALQDAKIDDAAMDLQQVKYELHKLFAQHLIQTVEQLGEINQILRAYTHL